MTFIQVKSVPLPFKRQLGAGILSVMGISFTSFPAIGGCAAVVGPSGPDAAAQVGPEQNASVLQIAPSSCSSRRATLSRRRWAVSFALLRPGPTPLRRASRAQQHWFRARRRLRHVRRVRRRAHSHLLPAPARDQAGTHTAGATTPCSALRSCFRRQRLPHTLCRTAWRRSSRPSCAASPSCSSASTSPVSASGPGAAARSAPTTRTASTCPTRAAWCRTPPPASTPTPPGASRCALRAMACSKGRASTGSLVHAHAHAQRGMHSSLAHFA